MALPSISTPEFTTRIPSTGQEVRYRPFLVKEEKILLMALEGNDQKEITKSILNLLSSCILDDIDTNKLATFDVEHLFLKLRGKSVGEVVELNIGHVSVEGCEHKTKVNVPLDDIKVQGDISDGKVMINDTVGLKLSYPTVAHAGIENLNSADGLFKLITTCIEYIFDEDEVYSDFTPQEIEDWIGQLNQGQFQKITDFFQNMPKLSYTLEWTCEKCGEKDKIELEGLQTFFT